jgi:beta-glucanase (GH16 family)
MRTYLTDTSSSGSLPHPVLILWPNTNNSGDGEIDFVEMNLGADLGAYLHCTTANGGIHANACYTAPYKSFDYSQYHTYSILWTPSGMSEYIDGQLWWTAPAPAASGTTFMPTVGMHLTIQLDNLSGTTPVDPGVMEVDWVHMYATD